MSELQCPECGRKLSKYLISFPMFLDDKDETRVYMICPLCALEGINKAQGLLKSTPFKREHSRKLYEDALKEIELSNQKKKKKPLPKSEIKWVKLTRLTPQEKKKLINHDPEENS